MWCIHTYVSSSSGMILMVLCGRHLYLAIEIWIQTWECYWFVDVEIVWLYGKFFFSDFFTSLFEPTEDTFI